MNFENLLVTIQNSSRKSKLQSQLKILQKSLDEDDNLSKYNSIKNELDASYDHITEGIHIKKQMLLYEHSENLQKFF